jgi:hypothetical protein
MSIHSVQMAVTLMGNAAAGWSLKAYVVCIILTAVALRLLTNRFKRGLRDIPGPTVAKYTRLWKLHSVWKGDHQNAAIDLHRKYGALVRIGPKHVSVSDTDAIQVIYGLNKGFTKVCVDSPKKKYGEYRLTSTRRAFILSSVYHGTRNPK